MGHLRQLVLQSFKKLHRTRMKAFAEDAKALEAARIKINEEYRKNKHVSDEEAISTMVKFGNEVANELSTQVIQIKEIKPGVYKARITEDTVKFENIPYNEDSITDETTVKRTTCCQNKPENK